LKAFGISLFRLLKLNIGLESFKIWALKKGWVQHTKTGKNIPNVHKVYQMAVN
jgi:hypothetical protein